MKVKNLRDYLSRLDNEADVICHLWTLEDLEDYPDPLEPQFTAAEFAEIVKEYETHNYDHLAILENVTDIAHTILFNRNSENQTGKENQ